MTVPRQSSLVLVGTSQMAIPSIEVNPGSRPLTSIEIPTSIEDLDRPISRRSSMFSSLDDSASGPDEYSRSSPQPPPSPRLAISPHMSPSPMLTTPLSRGSSRSISPGAVSPSLPKRKSQPALTMSELAQLHSTPHDSSPSISPRPPVQRRHTLAPLVNADTQTDDRRKSLSPRLSRLEPIRGKDQTVNDTRHQFDIVALGPDPFLKPMIAPISPSRQSSTEDIPIPTQISPPPLPLWHASAALLPSPQPQQPLPARGGTDYLDEIVMIPSACAKASGELAYLVASLPQQSSSISEAVPLNPLKPPPSPMLPRCSDAAPSIRANKDLPPVRLLFTSRSLEMADEFVVSPSLDLGPPIMPSQLPPVRLLFPSKPSETSENMTWSQPLNVKSYRPSVQSTLSMDAQLVSTAPSQQGDLPPLATKSLVSQSSLGAAGSPPLVNDFVGVRTGFLSQADELVSDTAVENDRPLNLPQQRAFLKYSDSHLSEI